MEARMPRCPERRAAQSRSRLGLGFGLGLGLGLGAPFLVLRIVQAERVVRIAVSRAGRAIGIGRRLGQHPIVRGNADVIRNALPAALQTEALVAAAPSGAATRLVPA